MIECIRNQVGEMAKTGLKLITVSVAALHDGRGVLKLRWQSLPTLISSQQKAVQAAQPLPFSESSLALDRCPFAAAEHAVLAAAAQCGAREVSRIEHAPLAHGANPYAPAAGLVAAFAETGYATDEAALRYEDFPECARALIERAADEGWITWLFRAACGSALPGFSDASTLVRETRATHHFQLMPFADGDYQHVYQLDGAPRRHSRLLARDAGFRAARNHERMGAGALTERLETQTP